MAKLADASDLGSDGATRGGSSPSTRTILRLSGFGWQASPATQDLNSKVKKTMKVSVLKKEGLTTELEVVVPSADIQKTVERELTAYGKNAKVPGFRPGKIPMQVLKQKYGTMIMGEVLEKTIQETSAKALKEQDIRPAMQPKIELANENKFDENDDLTYTMKIESLPTFEIADLSKLNIEKPVAKVADSAVNEMLEKIAKNNRDFTKVEEARATKMGDIVLVDFHGQTKEGKSVPGMSGHDMQVELGSGQLIPGFEEQLVGKKVGDHVHVDVTFPEDYGQRELAGQPAMFHVDIKELREPGETKIDDELAKKLKVESLDKMKELISGQISGDYEQMTRMKVKRALLDALDETHDFEMPQGMIDIECEAITKQMEREKEQSGEKLTDEEIEELKTIAERRVRLGLVLAEIGRQNKVEVSNEEVRRAIHAEARKYPGQETQVLEFYSKNPQVIESFRAPLYEEKVVDFILGQANITEKEVSAEELAKDDEELPKPKKKAAKK